MATTDPGAESPNRTAPSAICSTANPGDLRDRLAHRARSRMYAEFVAALDVQADHTILDIGVTSDSRYEMSNHLEALHPRKDKIVAAGIDDGASYLEQRYPGLTFRHADACDLPFRDNEFDFVHSSAVIEHVGSRAQQLRMIAECSRVARRGVFLTTPNRWFPVELHTLLPLVHWLPGAAFRRILRSLGHQVFATEEQLNLLGANDLERLSREVDGWDFRVLRLRLVGVASNLLLVGRPYG